MWIFKLKCFRFNILPIEARNLSDKEYDALKEKLQGLSWDFPEWCAGVGNGNGSDPCSGSQLALTEGEAGVSEAVWLRVTEIIDKMIAVDKVGAKKYDEMCHVEGTLSTAGKRLLSEIEDSLQALEDEKNKLSRIHRYKKLQDINCKVLIARGRIRAEGTGLRMFLKVFCIPKNG